jgi:hypothetical protein
MHEFTRIIKHLFNAWVAFIFIIIFSYLDDACNILTTCTSQYCFSITNHFVGATQTNLDKRQRPMVCFQPICYLLTWHCITSSMSGWSNVERVSNPPTWYIRIPFSWSSYIPPHSCNGSLVHSFCVWKTTFHAITNLTEPKVPLHYLYNPEEN